MQKIGANKVPDVRIKMHKCLVGPWPFIGQIWNRYKISLKWIWNHMIFVHIWMFWREKATILEYIM